MFDLYARSQGGGRAEELDSAGVIESETRLVPSRSLRGTRTGGGRPSLFRQRSSPLASLFVLSAAGQNLSGFPFRLEVPVILQNVAVENVTGRRHRRQMDESSLVQGVALRGGAEERSIQSTRPPTPRPRVDRKIDPLPALPGGRFRFFDCIVPYDTGQTRAEFGVLVDDMERS
jgi:hypothetical protein